MPLNWQRMTEGTFVKLLRLFPGYDSKGSSLEKAKMCFRLLDVNETGKLTMNQFCQLPYVFEAPIEKKVSYTNEQNGLNFPCVARFVRGTAVALAGMSLEQKKTAFTAMSDEQLTRVVNSSYNWQIRCLLPAMSDEQREEITKGLPAQQYVSVFCTSNKEDYSPWLNMDSNERKLRKQMTKQPQSWHYHSGTFWSECAQMTSDLFSYHTIALLVNIGATLEPFLSTSFPTKQDVADQTCDDFQTVFWMVCFVVFAIDLILAFLAFSTPNHPLWFIYPYIVIQDRNDSKFVKKRRIMVRMI